MLLKLLALLVGVVLLIVGLAYSVSSTRGTDITGATVFWALFSTVIGLPLTMFGLLGSPDLACPQTTWRELGQAWVAIGTLFGVCYGIALLFHLGLRFGFMLASLVCCAFSVWRSIKELWRRRLRVSGNGTKL